MRHVLYYPGILVPHDWLKKTILYSDKISSIYPRETNAISGSEEKLAQSNMDYLHALGMYEKTRPEQLDRRTYYNILRDLQFILDEDSLTQARERYRVHRSSYQIYLSKMNFEIRNFLFDNQIAKYDDRLSRSILVESNIGLLYMSLLAYHSTNMNDEYTTSTDEISKQNIIFERNDKLTNDYYFNMVLKEIPSPSPLTSLEDIIHFKTKRRNDLLLFRRYINEWTERIQSNSRNLHSFRDEFELFKLEMQRLMNDSGISTVGSTLEIVIPSTTGLAALFYSNMLENSDIISAAATTVSAIAINRIKTRFIRNAIQGSTPLSYLYHAKNDKII